MASLESISSELLDFLKSQKLYPMTISSVTAFKAKTECEENNREGNRTYAERLAQSRVERSRKVHRGLKFLVFFLLSALGAVISGFLMPPLIQNEMITDFWSHSLVVCAAVSLGLGLLSGASLSSFPSPPDYRHFVWKRGEINLVAENEGTMDEDEIDLDIVISDFWLVDTKKGGPFHLLHNYLLTWLKQDWVREQYKEGKLQFLVDYLTNGDEYSNNSDEIANPFLLVIRHGGEDYYVKDCRVGQSVCFHEEQLEGAKFCSQCGAGL